MYYSHLNQKQVPWIYGLRFNKTEFSLIFEASSDIFNFIIKYEERFREGLDAVVASHEYKSGTFELDLKNKKFGYEDVGDVLYFGNIVSISFPLLPKSKEPELRKKHYSKVAGSLSFLFGACKTFFYVNRDDLIIPTLGSPLQIFEVETRTVREMHGHCLGGYISPEFRLFMSEQGQLSYSELRILRDVFRKEAKKLFGYDGHALLIFEPAGGFLVQVPGNACDIGVYGDDRSHPIKYGAEFQSHNVDAAQQQLGLLMGLAMIIGCYYEKYPEANYKK